MTLNALALELMRSHSEDQTDSEYILMVEQWIRDALSEFNSATKWEHSRAITSFNTMAAVQDYDLPVDLGEIEMLRISNPFQTIEFIQSPEFLASRGFNFVHTGIPRYWCFVNANENLGSQVLTIRLFPTPSGVFSVERLGLYNIETLTSNTQIPLQTDKVVVLKDRIRSFMLEHDKDYDGADRAYTRFSNALASIVARNNRKPRANINSRMQINDVPRGNTDLARFDPSHY